METCDNLEYVGDPYDNMDLGEKKTHGISLYFQIIKVCGLIENTSNNVMRVIIQDAMEREGFSHGSKMDAYKTVADKIKVSMRTFIYWIKEWEALSYIRDSRRGQHSKTYSPILEDDKFREEFKSHVRENSKKQGNPI